MVELTLDGRTVSAPGGDLHHPAERLEAIEKTSICDLRRAAPTPVRNAFRLRPEPLDA